MSNNQQKFEEFKSLVDALQTDTAIRVANSTTKRGWNKTFGMSIPSIRDHVNDYNAKVRALNDMCYEACGKHLIAEEEAIKPVKLNWEDN
tara:strand:- start:434 stop:703 length:270 start_codon:yes stop_codon:yes gene_type:complete